MKPFPYSILVILFLIDFNSLPSQNIANLKGSLEQTSSDSIKAEIYCDLAYYYREVNGDSALYYAELALPLTQKTGNLLYQAYTLSELGVYYRNQEQFSLAEPYYLQSLQIRKQLPDKKELISGYLQLGYLSHHREDFAQAVLFLDSGLAVVQVFPNPSLESKLRSAKGTALFRNDQVMLGLEEFERSIRTLEDQGDSLNLAKGLNNLGNLYSESGQLVKAENNYSQAQAIYRALNHSKGLSESLINLAGIDLKKDAPSQALQKLLTAQKLIEDNGFSDQESELYSNLGTTYHQLGNLGKAEYFHRLDLNLVRENGNVSSLSIAVVNLSEVLLDQKRFNACLDLLNERYDSSQPFNSTLIMVKLEKIRAKAFQGLKEYEQAFQASIKVDSLEESILNLEYEVREYSDKLERDRANRNADRQELKIRAAELSLKQEQNRLMALAIVFLAFLSGLTIWFLSVWQNARWNKLRDETALSKEREAGLIKEKKILRLTRETELQVLRTKMETQDRERKRIARDLHDRLGSGLAVVQMHFTAIQDHLSQLPIQVQKEFNLAENGLDIACETVREVSHNLEAGALSLNNLETALESFCREIDQSAPLELQFYANMVCQELPRVIEREVLSITRTLVENILKHSNATKASVQIFCENESFRLLVEDNGQGFEVGKLNYDTGIGLKNVRHRVNNLMGEIEIDSGRGRGSHIHIQIPIFKT